MQSFILSHGFFFVMSCLSSICCRNSMGQVTEIAQKFDASAANVSLSLKEFERLFYGLRFEKSLIVEGKSKYIAAISISDGGGIRKSVCDYQQFEFGRYRSGTYSNRNAGWCFSTTISPDKPVDPQVNPDDRKPTLGIDFAAPGQDAATYGAFFGDYLFGFASKMSFSQFFKESKTTKVVELIDKAFYQGIRCDHPKLATLTIYFDDQGRVAYIKNELLPGQVVAGSKYEPSQFVPANSMTISLHGPLEYQTFEGREVIKGCNFKISAKNPKTVEAFSRLEFANYTVLTDELPIKISLPEIELVDGSKVTCFGKQSMDLEYRDGEVLVVVDGVLVDAAEKARYWRSAGGWFRFYTICGFGFALVFGFVVWYRNRGG